MKAILFIIPFICISFSSASQTAMAGTSPFGGAYGRGGTAVYINGNVHYLWNKSYLDLPYKSFKVHNGKIFGLSGDAIQNGETQFRVFRVFTAESPVSPLLNITRDQFFYYSFANPYFHPGYNVFENYLVTASREISIYNLNSQKVEHTIPIDEIAPVVPFILGRKCYYISNDYLGVELNVYDLVTRSSMQIVKIPSVNTGFGRCELFADGQFAWLITQPVEGETDNYMWRFNLTTGEYKKVATFSGKFKQPWGAFTKVGNKAYDVCYGGGIYSIDLQNDSIVKEFEVNLTDVVFEEGLQHIADNHYGIFTNKKDSTRSVFVWNTTTKEFRIIRTFQIKADPHAYMGLLAWEDFLYVYSGRKEGKNGGVTKLDTTGQILFETFPFKARMVGFADDQLQFYKGRIYGFAGTELYEYDPALRSIRSLYDIAQDSLVFTGDNASLTTYLGKIYAIAKNLAGTQRYVISLDIDNPSPVLVKIGEVPAPATNFQMIVRDKKLYFFNRYIPDISYLNLETGGVGHLFTGLRTEHNILGSIQEYGDSLYAAVRVSNKEDSELLSAHPLGGGTVEALPDSLTILTPAAISGKFLYTVVRSPSGRRFLKKSLETGSWTLENLFPDTIVPGYLVPLGDQIGGAYSSENAAAGFFIYNPSSSGVTYRATDEVSFFRSLAGVAGVYVSVTENSESDFGVYPNPFSGKLFITGNDHIDQVQVFDLTGRLILQQELEKQQVSIDLTQLSDGLYTVRLIGVDGLVCAAEKVILSR